MSEDKYKRILDEMSAKNIVDAAQSVYHIDYDAIDKSVFQDQYYTMSVAHYYRRMQGSQQSNE